MPSARIAVTLLLSRVASPATRVAIRRNRSTDFNRHDPRLELSRI